MQATALASQTIKGLFTHMDLHLVANMYGLPSKNVRIKTVDLIFSHIGFGRDIRRLCQNTHKLFLSYIG